MHINGPYIHTTGRLKGRKYLNIIDDNNRKKTTILYSRWLMQQHIGRKLDYDETVDHIDNDFTNDDISNLKILTRAENSAKYHSDISNTISWYEFICPECNNPSKKELRHVLHNRKQHKDGPFCSRSCASKYGRRKQLASLGKLAKPSDLGSGV